jgi:hypothetical protein
MNRERKEGHTRSGEGKEGREWTGKDGRREGTGREEPCLSPT